VGEAKRRRLLDPNYGQPQVPKQLTGVWSEFLDKQKDLAIVSIFDGMYCLPEEVATNFLFRDDVKIQTPKHLTITASSHNNEARTLFVEDRQQMLELFLPAIQQYGKGWIVQLDYPKQGHVQIGYVPATNEALTALQTELFTHSLGLIVGNILKCALNYWSLDPHHTLIPVLAISSCQQDPSWLFCI
jgi:hypothetical protein